MPWFEDHQTPTHPLYVLVHTDTHTDPTTHTHASTSSSDTPTHISTHTHTHTNNNTSTPSPSQRIAAWMSYDVFKPRAAYDGTAMLALYIHEDYRCKGIGTHMLTLALEICPRLGIHTLLGYIFAHNHPSVALFRKYGFEQWAYMPRVAVLDGVDRDLVILGKRVAP